uniref:Uncharacterized protein n=1 Tax=Parascaris equorum TaxID=6256 RepID=A0A914S5M6_PAREQ
MKETWRFGAALKYIRLQVASYALTLSYAPSKEYEALRAAVRTYVVWLSALVKEPHPGVPKPLKMDPQKYASEMIDALRVIFTRRVLTGSTPGSASINAPLSENDVAISRQAHEMQVVLKTITMLNSNCKEEHREYVWARSLHFLLNVGDLLLAGQSMP